MARGPASTPPYGVRPAVLCVRAGRGIAPLCCRVLSNRGGECNCGEHWVSHLACWLLCCQPARQRPTERKILECPDTLPLLVCVVGPWRYYTRRGARIGNTLAREGRLVGVWEWACVRARLVLLRRQLKICHEDQTLFDFEGRTQCWIIATSR